MDKQKISPTLLNKVNIMNNKPQTVIVTANNFLKAQNFFNEHNVKVQTYKFANCFFAKMGFKEIANASTKDYINYIYDNPKVKIFRQEEDVMNIHALTENKYFGQGQTICFIDTGIYPHLDFIFPKSRIIKYIDLINKINSPYDDNGHGTFVAGIASGNDILNKEAQGFASRANIIAIKALNSDGSSDSNIILDAMQWVYENHKKYKISVVCMSFGADALESSDPLSMGAEALWKSGITVIAAAGNSGPNKNTIKSPGNNPHIITVGALDVATMAVPDFSSRGPTIYGKKPDFLAPAVNVVSCLNGLGYTTMSGTSVATPIVAGICAIIKSKYPKATNNQIKQFLINHCKKLTGDTDKEGAGYLCF